MLILVPVGLKALSSFSGFGLEEQSWLVTNQSTVISEGLLLSCVEDCQERWGLELRKPVSGSGHPVEQRLTHRGGLEEGLGM